MARQYKVNRIKLHRNYEVEEAAELLGVSAQTVRQWIKDGLPALTERRPYLILGWELREFLAAREAARKHPLGPGEFYCLSCKVARKPAYGMTERVVSSDGRAMLKGFCEACEAPCNLFVAA